MTSRNLINHWNMNWNPFKDSVSHMCLADTVVAPLFLTQEVAGLKTFCCSDKYLGKSQVLVALIESS